MSSPILPIQGPLGQSSRTPDTRTAPADAVAFLSELASNDARLTIAAARGGPPPEVLEQMAAAGGIEEGIREAGYELRFATPLPGARVSIELRDLDSNRTRVVSVGEAFDIAAGKPVGVMS